jgi:hypothetical protein
MERRGKTQKDWHEWNPTTTPTTIATAVAAGGV